MITFFVIKTFSSKEKHGVLIKFKFFFFQIIKNMIKCMPCHRILRNILDRRSFACASYFEQLQKYMKAHIKFIGVPTESRPQNATLNSYIWSTYFNAFDKTIIKKNEKEKQQKTKKAMTKSKPKAKKENRGEKIYVELAYKLQLLLIFTWFTVTPILFITNTGFNALISVRQKETFVWFPFFQCGNRGRTVSQSNILSLYT